MQDNYKEGERPHSNIKHLQEIKTSTRDKKHHKDAKQLQRDMR